MYIRLYNKGYKRIAKFFYWLNRIFFSCDIPCSVVIGKNLRLPHFGLGVVIRPNTVIGDRVTIYHQVTIGTRTGERIFAHIGDDAMLGAGCKVLGGVKIGNHVKVGANSVVLNDIPDGATAVGIPAKVLHL